MSSSEAGEVREMVARHDEAIGHVTQSIERLANAVEKTDDKMDKVIEALSQNAVILEKISNVDSSNKDSVNRLHRRIDDLEGNIQAREDAMILKINSIGADAANGAKGYDLVVFTTKAIAWVFSIGGLTLAGLLWLIQHA